jgi:hypothetical protein
MSIDDRIVNIIITNVESTIDRKLAYNEKAHVKSYYLQLDKSQYRGKKVSDIISPLVQHIIKKLSFSKSHDINITDYFKSTIGVPDEKQSSVSNLISTAVESSTPTDTDLSVDSFLGVSDVKTLQLLLNPESLYTHHYLSLDTDYRLIQEAATSNVSQFKWNYTESQNLREGFCNSVSKIENIIGIRLYQPRIPFISAIDTSAKRVSVLIEEFAAQAYIAENGRRFQYILRPDYINATATQIELTTEDYNDGIYWFRQPITTFESITISFADPLTILSFPSDFARFVICLELICMRLN